jgi:4-aminobutyrate aminotransferase
MLFERSVPASDVAAILVEPIQGEGRLRRAARRFLAGLRALCDAHGILLIFDEVQSGIGRSGRMFACQHWGVAPDLMTLAKGLVRACRSGALVARNADVAVEAGRAWQYLRRQPDHLRGGERDDRPGRGRHGRQRRDRRRHFIAQLHALAREFPCIGEVRGKGLMIGMELIETDAARTPARALCDAVITRAFHNGLLLLSCGTSTVRFMPPLNVTTAEIDEAIALLRTSLREALAGHGA